MNNQRVYYLPIQQGDLQSALKAIITALNTKYPVILIGSHYVDEHNTFSNDFQCPLLKQYKLYPLKPIYDQITDTQLATWLKSSQVSALTKAAIAYYVNFESLCKADYAKLTVESLKQISMFYEYSRYHAFNDLIQSGEIFNKTRFQHYLALFNTNGLVTAEQQPVFDQIEQSLTVYPGELKTGAEPLKINVAQQKYYADYTAYHMLKTYPQVKNAVVFSIGYKSIFVHVRSLEQQAPVIAAAFGDDELIVKDMTPRKASIEVPNFDVYNLTKNAVLGVLSCIQVQK